MRGLRIDKRALRGLVRPFALWLFFVSLPFVMFSWLFPFIAPITIGNDYLIFSPGAEMDLMWSVWKGTFPLYMPGFAGGHSTASLTMGQLYHPIPWISSIMPGYWHTYSLEWNTLFRLISMGLAHLSLFKLCRRLKLDRLPAFVATFPVVYNLRMLDSFRYGASIDSYIGMLFVGAAVGFVFLDEGKKRPVAFLALSTYLIAVSGHPQWAFLGLLISGLFALLFPWTASALDPGYPRPERRQLARYIGRLILGFGSGLLLATPYLLTFYFEYFKTNHSRAENDYSWTLGWGDSARGELSNFLFPLHSDVHGAFAGSALTLIAALFPLAAIAKKPPRVLWILYGIGAVAFLYSFGKETVVHSFMVKHLPLFGAFRVPGRIVIWIPLMTLPVLAWMLRADNRRALSAACAGALVIFASNWLFTSNSLPATEVFSPHKILNKVMPPYMDSLILWLSGVTLFFLAGAARYRRVFRSLFVIAAAGMMVTTWFCLFEGTWRQKKPPNATFQQIADLRKANANTRSDPGYGMEMRTVTEYQAHHLKPERELGTIAHRVEQLVSEPDVIKRLQEKSNRIPLFLDRPVAPLSEETVSDHDEVKLVYNTSNRFIFEANAARDGYFVLGVPHLPGFQCKIDGAPAVVARANALFPAVFLPRGAHRVDFRFVSWPFMVGVTLSFLTFWTWILVAFHRRRRLLSIAAVLAAAALGGLLYFSLYNAPSFDTNYRWQAKVEPAKLPS